MTAWPTASLREATGDAPRSVRRDEHDAVVRATTRDHRRAVTRAVLTLAAALAVFLLGVATAVVLLPLLPTPTFAVDEDGLPVLEEMDR